MSTFEWDGEKFEFITDLRTFNMDEIDALEEYYGEDFDVALKRKGRMTRAFLWISISRQRPGFGLADAGRVEIGLAADAADAAKTALARKAPRDHQEGVVLSPTSAGNARTRKPAIRKRAAGGAATQRSSRTSLESDPGSSDV